MSQETFGHRLRELRKARNLTQRELAERVEVDFTYLSKLENDRMPPPALKTIERIARALEADLHDLVFLAGKTPTAIEEQIRKCEGSRSFFRTASGMNLSEEDWAKLLRTLKRLGGR